MTFRLRLWPAAALIWAAAEAAAAQETATPAGTIDLYYQAVRNKDCSTAVRLRPGYSLAACKGVETVSAWLSTVIAEAEGRAAVFLQVDLERNGTMQQWAGFVTLVDGANGWRIVTDSFKQQTDGYGIADYLTGHFLAATLHKQEVPGLPDQATGDLPPPTSFDPPPVGPAILSYGASGGAFDTYGQGGDPDPAVLAFQAHYDALDQGNCPHAASLRQPADPARCASVREVLQAEATVVTRDATRVVLQVKIALRRRTAEDDATLEDFRGLVTMVERDRGWIIAGESYRSDPHGVGRADYLAEMGLTAAALPDDLTLRLGNLVPPPGASTAPFWDFGGPTEFGSRAVMDACWSRRDLHHRPGEEKTSKTAPGAFLPPPLRKEPRLMLNPLSDRYRRSIRSVDTGGRKLVALTFDTGELNNDLAGYDGEIVDYLRAEGVKATFYLGGKWMATHPERAQQLIADPLFEMGNHAWTHGNLRVIQGQDASDQILFTQAQYEVLLEDLWARDCAQAAGSDAFARIPPTLATYRFAYGTCSDETLRMVNDFGLPAVQWDVVTSDPNPRIPAQAIALAVLQGARPGSIVIMHANGRGWNTAEALPLIIPGLRKLGYEFVTVSELLEAGEVRASDTCFERKPGDNLHYDRYGRGTGD